MTQPAGDQYELIPFEAVPFLPASGSQLLVSPATLVGGWSFRETTGAAQAEIQIFDGQTAQSVPYAFITLNAGQSVRDFCPTPGLFFRQGLFVALISGVVTGSVWVRLL